VDCPGEDTVAAFAEGRLAAPAIAEIDAHVATCGACQDLFAVALATGTHGRSQTAGVRARAAALGAAAGELPRGASIGRYTILALVGRGGMGRVYAAYDPELDRKIALKLLQAGAGPDPARSQARLLREAKALAKLSHPNVVAVHDAGTFEGRVFVAMQFVDGVTLKQWLAERPRTRPEILDVFTDAARGLAAAHAAGLVHRDFKPTNVMIGKDGSVRVADFGLARSIADEASEPRAIEAGARRAPHDPSLTGTRELLGTPLYMAPEQFLLRPADARTDQFSFCVAVYQALYGAPPFGLVTSSESAELESLAARVVAGRVEAAPLKSAVPAWLRRVLLRGLSADPAARWPSMDALVAALGRDPARAGRRAAFAGGALLLVGLSVLTLARGAARRASLCEAGPARLGDVWEGPEPQQAHPRRAAVEKAFLASGAPDARDLWERASRLLDRYRARWLDAYRGACEAAHVRHTEPAALLELRMTCLDERRFALASLVNVLVTADRDGVKNAIGAANALPALDRCADRAQLEEPVEAPRDDAARKRVDALRRRAAISKALDDTGKHDEAAAQLQAEIAEARAVGYRPLLAELLLAFGRCFVFGNFRAEVLPAEEEALWTALAVSRNDLAAEAAVALVGHLGGSLGRPDEGQAWAKIAQPLLDRAGGGHEILRSWLLVNEAQMATHDERMRPHALELIESAVAIKEKVLPPDHPDLAGSLNNEADILTLLGRRDEALRLNGRAYEMYVRAFGPASAEAATTLSNRGEILIALGRPAEALAALRRALPAWEAQIGPEHPYLAYALTALGRALLALARPAEALPPLERALRLREANDHDPSNVAETRFALARALWDARADHTRALALAEKARASYDQAHAAKDAALVEAWLAPRAGARARAR
jgi:hypothetical protein